MKCSNCRKEIHENDGECGDCVHDLVVERDEWETKAIDLEQEVAHLQDQVDKMENGLDELRRENDDLKDEVDVLEGRLKDG